jgi:radical SAM superfamily enzyme YgiQ (UPF0313 family)
MRALLIYPEFPLSFWCYRKSLELRGRKAALPPLNVVTVAAILPQDWEFKVVDRRVRSVTEAEWNWAELVVISGMIVQQEDYLAHIREAKRRGKPVAVGGPYPTSTPEPAKAAGADYLILDEGELTIPMFLEALERGETSGIFRSAEKPDVTTTPIPRYDLLDFSHYESMSVQFSRGCPFQCEFCDIIVLYGRKPRTKAPDQLIRELDYLYELGWRGSIFMVDDNFIGNKRNVKLLLKEVKPWQIERNYPFSFVTEASIDLAKDAELLDLMVDCNFWAAFVGIESPDESSLQITRKFQNLRDPLLESVETIQRAGIQVIAGFIIGFDGEKAGAGDRIVEFVQKASIQVALYSILHAFPNTALRTRLIKEGRLIEGDMYGDGAGLMNFIPTRPIEDLAREYAEGFWKLYEPKPYLERQFELIKKINETGSKHHHCDSPWSFKLFQLTVHLIWKYGVSLDTRWLFWSHVWTIFRHYPEWLAGYFTGCAQLEHFLEYREVVQDRMKKQLANYQKANHPSQYIPEETVQQEMAQQEMAAPVQVA